MNKKNILIIFTMLIFVLTGCGEKKNELSLNETARKLSKTLQTINGFHVNLNTNIVTSDGKNNIIIDGYVKNSIGKLTAEVKNNNSKKYDIYINLSNEYDNILMYFKAADTDDWLKVEQDKLFNLNMNTDEIYKLLLNIFNSDVMEQKSANKNNYNYDVSIKGELFNSIFSKDASVNNIDSFINIDNLINGFATVNDKIKLQLGISRNEFYISKLSMDLAKALNAYLENDKYQKFQIDLKLSDYNKETNIEVPEEVVRNAKFYDNPTNYSTGDVELKKFMNSGYDIVLACDYNKEQEVYFGFKNNVCVDTFTAINMITESKNYARQIADEYVLGDNEKISVNGSIVRITKFENINDETINYDELKKSFINSGYECK